MVLEFCEENLVAVLKNSLKVKLNRVFFSVLKRCSTLKLLSLFNNVFNGKDTAALMELSKILIFIIFISRLQ